MDIEIKENNGVKYAIGWCQYCGHVEKTDVGDSTESSAKVATHLKLELHEKQCPENPDREKSEMSKYLDDIFGKNGG